MMFSKYFNRIIEKEIMQTMKAVGCIVLEGAKGCGKSTTCQRFAKSIIELQDPRVYEKYKLMIANDNKIFDAEKPILFDEWQKVPELWDMIRTEVDHNNAKGAFILTGSAKPLEDSNRHSGVGRFARITMRPMSLYESCDSTGDVSLKDLFEGMGHIEGESNLTLEEVAELLCRGGWPATMHLDSVASQTYVAAYYKLLTEVDLTNVDGIRRNPERARKILRSLARNISSFVTDRTIIEDVKSNDMTMDEKTLATYLNALRKLFVIEDLQAWTPKLRSKTTIRLSDKRQFVDPSLATAALGISSKDLLNDPETFGLFFESLCIRDLRVYAESLNGFIHQYHDRTGLEADAIIHLNDGSYGLVEIKLGRHRIEEAVTNLLKLKNKVDTAYTQEPKFLMVLTGSGLAYRRKEDGIYVIPIGCLKN